MKSWEPGRVSDAALEALLRQVRRSTKTQSKALIAALNEYNSSVPDTCPLAEDKHALRGKQRSTVARLLLYDQGWRQAFLTARNVADHVAAIGDTSSSAEPRVFAHMTLARAALEGAARVHYLLHPEGTTLERVLRAATTTLVSAEEEMKAVDDLGDANHVVHQSALVEATRRLDEAVDLIAQAGIVVRRTKRGDVLSLRWKDETAETKPPVVSVLLRDLLPSKPAAYRISSGAVHSQPWALDDDQAFDPLALRLWWPLDPAGLASSVDLGISASALVIATFAAMLGHDHSRQQIEAQRREQAVSQLVIAVLRGR